MSNEPQFDSEFLNDIAVSFRKRRKAIAYRASQASYVKVYELVGREKQERLEIELQDGVQNNGAVLRMHAWQDRLIWLDARKSSKSGWAWSWTFDGRLLGNHTGRAAIEALEQTLDLLGSMDKAKTSKLSQIWVKLLARGPIRI